MANEHENKSRLHFLKDFFAHQRNRPWTDPKSGRVHRIRFSPIPTAAKKNGSPPYAKFLDPSES